MKVFSLFTVILFFSAQVRLDLECVLLCGDSFIVCLDRKGKARASVNLECNISGHTWGLGKYVHPPDMGLVRLLINTTKSTPHPHPPPLPNSSSFSHSYEASLHKKTSRSASRFSFLSVCSFMSHASD